MHFHVETANGKKKQGNSGRKRRAGKDKRNRKISLTLYELLTKEVFLGNTVRKMSADLNTRIDGWLKSSGL